ncbi:hypothetical protein MBLNU457_g0515t1 [Dothideomycetes sp. NU457]
MASTTSSSQRPPSPSQPQSEPYTRPPAQVNGDLNNTLAARPTVHLDIDPAYISRSLAISEADDDPEIRRTYRPFLLAREVEESDWVSKLELSTAMKMAEEDLAQTGSRLKVLVLYGSLRERSYSKLLAFEACRILHRLGCDVRMYSPRGLPVKDDVSQTDPKVEELRTLSRWSDGHVWISPEQHGTLTGVFKNQIDWIPLSTGSVRPTQGRTLAIAQVSGGSQSFNAVNALRILGRWMRMFVVPNQSSVEKAYTQFTESEGPEGGSRMMPSGMRDRIVDCMEEFVKYTIVMRERFDLFGDRFSERREREKKAAKEEAERKKKAESDGVNGVDIEKI